MTINFNTEPYYDDFNEDSKFYRILYRPGYAVQARELTQMQTILQNQISKFGTNVFKEGARVIPGEASIDLDVGYIKLESTYGGVLTDTIIANFQGLVIQNSSGLQAEVIFFSKSSGSDPATLFVRYKNSGDDNETRVFANSDIIEDVDGTYQVQAISSAATGKGSLATITRGVYYTKGHFVLVEDQTIVLDKFSNTPSYRIGLVCTESIVTAEEDSSLFDNAQNSFNYAAPGAHRYSITAVLTKLAIDSTSDKDFIEVKRVLNGAQLKSGSDTEYGLLAREFARRTYDESGDYTVKNFEIDVREYRNNDRGAWANSRAYLIGDVVTNDGKTYVAKKSAISLNNTPPTHTTATAVYDGAVSGVGTTGVLWEYTTNPQYNRGVHTPATTGGQNTVVANEANEAKLAIGLEPGKAYVQGYLIEKPSTEYVTVNKSRDSVILSNENVPATVGNYVVVKNVNYVPPLSTFAEVTIYDRVTSSVGVAPTSATAIGTARVRLIEWDNGVIGTQAAQYKLSLFDIKMNGNYDFDRKAKSFYYAGGSAATTFTADIEPIKTRLTGSLTSYTANTYATVGAGIYIQGAGTSFQTDLIVGDYIDFNGTVVRVVTVDSQTRITVSASVTIVGLAFDRIATVINQPENTSLIFPLSNYAVKDVRSDLAGTINSTIYTVYNIITGESISSNSITVNTDTGVFTSEDDADNYIVIDTNGVIRAVTNVTGEGTTTATITTSGATDGNAIVIAAVNVSGLGEKAKELVSNATATFTTAATAQLTELKLGKADGYRLVSVKMKSGTFSSPGDTYSIDITDRYEFDDGQRDTHYDLARIVLKNSYAPPEAPIEVTFDHFTHGTGDYFTKNSYPAGVDYKNIPSYGNISLRDCFDFRSRINDAGTGFTSTGAKTSLVLKRGQPIITSYSYYLARKTKIAVDQSGAFFALDGVSSLNPGEPIDPSLGMALYTLTLEPYTFGTSDNSVQIARFDNRRYTMRDIGKLEKRIDNLEYYTSLSLLEQQTESLNVTDSAGETRFKNGFIVDNFAGHSTGDSASKDYVCSIDMEQAELRPFYSMKNINLVEVASDQTTRIEDYNYQLYGDVIGLPKLSDIAIVTQQYASRLENINPFAVFTFLGDVKINPSSDDWFEVDRRMDIVVDVEGNFNTVKRLAEKAGVLGTIWNAWQTQWTGKTISSGLKFTSGNETIFNRAMKLGMTNGGKFSTDRNRFGVLLGSYKATETFATQIGQSRTGLKTTLVSKVDKQIVGDRVLSTAVIPYMRSRNILVQIQKLKPGTRFYPFFDNVDISAYCTPASKIVYTPTGATTAAKIASYQNIDIESNVGGNMTETARRINGDSQVCLNKGELITGGTSGATAVVVGKEYNSDDNTFALYVLNVKGSFTTETITGSISGATGTFGSITTGSQGDNLISNFNGQVQFIFDIPNTESVRFRCGSRELKLVDVATADGDFTSRARANYRAEGVQETRQYTVNAVRNAELVEERLSDTQTITQTTERVISGSQWYDPLAQTFLIEQKGGCFLTKIDIFFATKDPKIPVTLEVREVVNGYPGKNVLPFSRVTLKPEEVNLSANTVTLDGVETKSYDTATTFNFPSPVYVQEGVEYAVVLASDSNQYKVWVSQVGETMPGTSRTISEQPYLGSLFKSQNSTTWTADQTQDLKFVVYRAQFDTSVQANIAYANDVLPLVTLDTDPFEIKNGSTTVRVWHANHGMPEGSKVIISGVGAALNGIPAAEFNATHDIDNVGLDYYTITVSTSATSSGYAGGTSVKATTNFQFDAIQPSMAIQSFPETPISFGFKATTGKTVYSNQTPYADPETMLYGDVLVNETNFFSAPKMVASEINESTVGANGLGGSKSLGLNVVMSSTNDALSPILDTHRTSLIAISNKVNSPTAALVNVGTLDDTTVLSANATIAFTATTAWAASTSVTTGSILYYGSNQYLVTVAGTTGTVPPVHLQNSVTSGTAVLEYQGPTGGTISSSNTAAKNALATLTVGKYVEISGSSNSGNNTTYLVKSVAVDGSSITVGSNVATVVAGDSVTIKQKELFVSDISSESTTYSKYVTKRINLSSDIKSTMLKVQFAVNLPIEADVEVWYKTSTVGLNQTWETIPYVQMKADAVIANFSNATNAFVDASYSIENLDAFDAVTVKLVMKSTNSSEIPRIKDLRVLALAS
jgi:hypothetical protein